MPSQSSESPFQLPRQVKSSAVLLTALSCSPMLMLRRFKVRLPVYLFSTVENDADDCASTSTGQVSTSSLPRHRLPTASSPLPPSTNDSTFTLSPHHRLTLCQLLVHSSSSSSIPLLSRLRIAGRRRSSRVRKGRFGSWSAESGWKWLKWGLRRRGDAGRRVSVER